MNRDCTRDDDYSDSSTLLDIRQRITTPNYPEEYPRSWRCLWTLAAPKGRQIKLHFETFDIKKCNNEDAECGCDYVQFWNKASYYDGSEAISDKFCGQKPPSDFVSKENSFTELVCKKNSIKYNILKPICLK